MAINGMNSYLLSYLMENENVNRTGKNGKSEAATDSSRSLSGTSFSSTIQSALTKKSAAGASSDNLYSGSQTLEDIFERASLKYGISKKLLKAVAKAESNFRADARSSAGAGGIMQLMPSTARAHGVTNVYDPEQNIMAGAEILSSNLKTYQGDLSLALAAYNAGGGNVRKYGGVPPFKETRNYIAKIQKMLGEEEPILNQPLSGSGVPSESKYLTNSGSLSDESAADSDAVSSLLSGLGDLDSTKTLLLLELLRQQAMLDASRQIGSMDYDEDGDRLI